MTEQNPQGCPFHAGTGHTDSLTRYPGGVHPEAKIAPKGKLMQAQSYEESRALLKDTSLVQAGFLAHIAGSAQGMVHPPVLYMQGEEHTEMRRATARYFTPATVNTYGPMIISLSEKLIGELHTKGEMNLDDLSLRLAVQVASNVVGLTDSRLPGMEKRIEAFVSTGLDGAPGAEIKLSGVQSVTMLRAVGLFFMLDVRPAIAARRAAIKRGQPKDDLITYLLERHYSDQDILTECITYATAGMITTREFITLAAYQMLQRPALRYEYLHGTEKERHSVLHELLRLDPVVTTLYRQARQETQVGQQTFGAGTTFALNVQAANVDPAIMGSDAERLCPHRPLPKGVQAQGLAFGDGPHRCPGAFLAIKETDIFLRRLLMLGGLSIAARPTVSYNEIVKGYELRGLRLRLD